jgi:hypothetical protein
MTLSGMRGVLNDAISLYFADAILASALVAQDHNAHLRTSSHDRISDHPECADPWSIARAGGRPEDANRGE